METKGWTAGILDGEGYIAITDNRAVVRVDNTDIRILQKLAQNWGGKIYENRRNFRPNSKKIWFWIITGWKAIPFLIEIEPYLVSKSERARKAIEFYKEKSKSFP